MTRGTREDPFTAREVMEENAPPESPSSVLALVCGWICLAAYLWPILHALGGTYDGAMTCCLSYLFLIPAVPIGSIAAFLALTKDPVTAREVRRSKRALAMIWFPIAAMILIVFADSVRRNW